MQKPLLSQNLLFFVSPTSIALHSHSKVGYISFQNDYFLFLGISSKRSFKGNVQEKDKLNLLESQCMPMMGMEVRTVWNGGNFTHTKELEVI